MFTTRTIDRRRQLTIVYFAVLGALGLVMATLGPTLPGLSEQTDVQLSQISILFTTRSLGHLLGALFIGRLYDRWPGHRLQALMLVLMGMGLFAVPSLPALWLVALVMLVLGAAEGSLDSGTNTLLIWLHGDKVGPYMNAMHLFFGVGAIVSPLIVARSLALTGGIAWAYWLVALIILPLAGGLLRLPSPAIVNTREDTRAAANPRLVVLIAFFLLLYVGGEVSFGGWIFSYTVALELGTAASAAYLTSAFWGALTAGRLLSIPLATAWRPRTLLLVSLLGGVASLTLLVALPASLAVVWVGTLGTGLSMAAVFPTTLSFAERHMPINGRITGWFFVGSSMGGMVIPWAIGQLFESISPRVTMVVVLLTIVAEVVVLLVMLTYAARHSAESTTRRKNPSQV